MPEYWIIAVHYENNAIFSVRCVQGFSKDLHRCFRDIEVHEDDRERIWMWVTTGLMPVRTGLVESGGDGETWYRRGAEVKPTHEGTFITTEADGKKRTNLEHLPRY